MINKKAVFSLAFLAAFHVGQAQAGWKDYWYEEYGDSHLLNGLDYCGQSYSNDPDSCDRDRRYADYAHNTQVCGGPCNH